MAVNPTDKEFIYGYEAGLKKAGQPVAINAGQVAYDPDGTYTDGTVGADLKSLDADVSNALSAISDIEDYAIDRTTELKDHLLSVKNTTNFYVGQNGTNANVGYLKNGSVVSDDKWRYSDYIPLEGGKQYTIGYVPVYGSCTEPSFGCPVKLECFDANKTFISDVTTLTFTTPLNTKYVRLNLAHYSGINESTSNVRTMIVEGSSLPETYALPKNEIWANPAETESICVGYGAPYTEISAIHTKADYRGFWYKNGSNLYVISFAPTEGTSCKIYPVTKGNWYRVYGFGYDANAYYMGAFSQLDLVEMNVTSACDLTGFSIETGRTDYPAGYTFHTRYIQAPADGYLYVNEKTSVGTAKCELATKTVKTAPDVIAALRNAGMSNGVLRSNGKYYCFHAEGESNIIMQFERRGPNNLFQWDQIYIGDVTEDGIDATKTYANFGTDIVGPISIFNSTLFPGQAGKWSGGNHSVTVSDVEYATAEQIDFKCLVNGTEITQDGLYYGDVKFIAKNKLYFPQSVTGADLTEATPAIIEHRYYEVTDRMHVRVWLEFVEDVRVSTYYGMQFVDSMFDQVFAINNGYIGTFANITENTLLSTKERKLIFSSTDDSLCLEGVMDDIGLGQYGSALNDGNSGYVRIAKHVGEGGYNKTYYVLIYTNSQPNVEDGTNLSWEGTYRLYLE